MFLRILFFFLIGLLGQRSACAQILHLHQLDSATNPISYNAMERFPNDQELAKAIRKFIPKLQEQGYLSASIDSMYITENKYELYFFAVSVYRWVTIKLDSLPKGTMAAINIDNRQFDQKTINPKQFAHLSNKILNYYEENGYPFAQVWLDDLNIDNKQQINAQLKIVPAESRKIDSIIIIGDVSISSAFIHRYLDIAKGTQYDEKKLKNISRRINDLAFLQESSAWQINFRPGDTRLNLFLKEKKSNQLNAILGLMPNNRQTNKLLLTADVQFALQNILGYGESLSASYQNLQEKSPRIKADFIQPYIGHSAVGAEMLFDFFSSNLDFRKISLQTGLRYQLSTTDLFKIYYQATGNRIISIDTASILNSKKLPPNIDAKSNGIGMELQSNHTDYRLNPKKGWQARINVLATQRKILRNNTILDLKDGTSFDFSSLYDSLQQKTLQYHLVADLAEYIPLGRSISLKLGYNGGYIAAPKIFQNELFMIGGFKMLRGFDEQSIFANQYHIGLAELRFRFDKNSFAYLFSDNGWVQTKFNNYDKSAWYNGFGIGTTLEAKSGLFSIALAFGRSDQIPLRFRESKLTFGYIAIF